jgi:hypothetical protein
VLQNWLVDLHDLNLSMVEDEDALLMVIMAACVDSPNNELQISRKAIAELKERMKSLKPGNKPVLVSVNDEEGIRVKFMVTEQEICDFVQDFMPD